MSSHKFHLAGCLSTCFLGESPQPSGRLETTAYPIRTSVFRNEGLQFYMPRFLYPQHHEDIFISLVGLRGHIIVGDFKGKVLASKINRDSKMAVHKVQVQLK